MGTPPDLKKYSDFELAEYQAGWKADTVNYILAGEEFKRRREAPGAFRSWVSIVISVLALVVAVAAIVYRK